MPEVCAAPIHPRDLTLTDIIVGVFQLPELAYRATMADTFARRAPANARRWLSVLGNSPTIEGEWLGQALRRRYGSAVEYDADVTFAIAAK